MSASAVPRRRALLLVPLTLVALLAWWASRSGSEAAPSAASAAPGASQAGKIAFDSLPGAVRATLPLRTFAAGGTNTSSPVGGGGGGGKFVADDLTAVVDASNISPLLLGAVATGVHLKKVTVTLFRPGTKDRQEVWELADVTLSEVHSAQSGSAKPSRTSLGLRYNRVTLTTFDAQGAVARTFCFALDANTAC